MLDSPAHSLPIARMRRDTCIVVASDCITTPYAERCVVLLVRPLLHTCIPCYTSCHCVPINHSIPRGDPKSDCISPGKESNRHALRPNCKRRSLLFGLYGLLSTLPRAAPFTALQVLPSSTTPPQQPHHITCTWLHRRGAWQGASSWNS